MHGCSPELAPCKRGMVADPHRIDPPHQARQLVQMPIIQPCCRTQRQTHSMQTDGVLGAAAVKYRQRRATLGKEVLGMHFQKIEGWAALQQLGVVGMAPTHADMAHAGVIHRRHSLAPKKISSS